jgi:ABC-2 type transport system permease protein
LQVIPVIVLTNLTFVALGFFSAAFTILFQRGDPFRLLVGGASVLLGGVFYPTDLLPSWIGWVGNLLPITHGARTLRGILLRGETIWQYEFEVWLLIAFNLVLLPLGLYAFYWAVRRARLDGTLFQY